MKLEKEKTAKISSEERNEWFVQDHQNIYKSKKGLKLTYIAVGNIALKRIEDEVYSAKKKQGDI